MLAKVTKRVVDAAKAGVRVRIIWDEALKGFGLRVTPAGAKSYVVQYRVGRGRNAPSRRITIGRRTPELARKEAQRLLGKVAAGSDPAEARKAEARGMTIAELCDLYLAEGVGHKKPSTIKNDRSRMEHHIRPLIGRLRLDKITRAEIERMQRDITTGKTAARPPEERRQGGIVHGGPGTAAQAIAVLGAVMSFAVSRGLRDDNPVRGVKKAPTRKMERFLSETEIARLAEALDQETARTGDPYPAAAIKLLLFTGCRRSEIMTLRWADVDFERAFLVLPDSKTGRKVVYLNAPALAALADLPRQMGNPHVICGHREGARYVGLDKVWQRVRNAARLDGVRLHDLRHSFASIGAGAGLGLPIVGKLLGHTQSATTQRYAHLADDPLRRAAEAIGSHIAAAMEQKPAAEVVPLPKARA
jgi:integrase